MAHVFQIPDEMYAKLVEAAARQGQTPEALLLSAAQEIVDREDIEFTDEEIANSPLLQVAGIFAIHDPGWADRHDEILAQELTNNHMPQEE